MSEQAEHTPALYAELYTAELTLADWTRRAEKDWEHDYSALIAVSQRRVQKAKDAIAKATGSPQ